MSTSDLLNAVHNGQCWPCMKIIETHKNSVVTMDFYQRTGRLATAYAVFISCWRMLEIAGFNQTAVCGFLIPPALHLKCSRWHHMMYPNQWLCRRPLCLK